MQCIFCAIANGDIVSEVLFKDQHVFVIKDIKPKAPVHLLIIPVAHVLDLDSDEKTHQLALSRMFNVAAQMAICCGIEQTGYRLIINQGSDANQEIEHLHMHVLGGENLGS